MNHQNMPLALALLRTQPKVAAQILEQNSVHDVADFIRQIPIQDSAQVLLYLMPCYMARVCKSLEVEKTVKLLSTLNNNHITTILRYLDKQTRQQILAKLSIKKAASCRLLLKYSNNCIGAWLTNNIAISRPDKSLGETLQMLSKSTDLSANKSVFIINTQHQYQGRIDYLELIKHDANDLLSTHIQPQTDVLFARMELDKALKHWTWNNHDSMPVVDREQRFIGVLEHKNLRQALQQKHSRISEHQGQDPLSGIAGVYATSLISLFKTMNNVVQTESHL